MPSLTTGGEPGWIKTLIIYSLRILNIKGESRLAGLQKKEKEGRSRNIKKWSASSAAPPPLCFLKCLKHPDGDLESHRRLFVCLSGKMRAKWRRRGEGTAGGTWGRSFISSWRIRGNLCISSGALQACKSNEGYGFLRSRTTARSGGCFGGNHKLLGWLTLRLALGEEKGKKTRIIMYVSDYDSSSCDLHLHLWQESWSSCTARSRGITESGWVSRHFVAFSCVTGKLRVEVLLLPQSLLAGDKLLWAELQRALTMRGIAGTHHNGHN